MLSSAKLRNDALLSTVYEGDIEKVRLLIAQGAKINATSCSGMITIHIAAQEGQVDAIKVLQAAGANLNSVDKDGPFLLE